MPSKPLKAPDRAEIQRLLTQLERLESRSGRRAAAVAVAVPAGVDPKAVAKVLREHSEAEIIAHSVAGSGVCRISTIEFELADSGPSALSARQGFIP